MATDVDVMTEMLTRIGQPYECVNWVYEPGDVEKLFVCVRDGNDRGFVGFEFDRDGKYARCHVLKGRLVMIETPNSFPIASEFRA